MPPPFDPSEVDALFEAAIDESPPRRRALLEARCAGRPELLEEVWALLQIDARRPADFLENPPVALSPRDEALSPAARIGRFAVLSRVGEGGMGVVYAAYDGELDRRVALKLLAPGMVGPEGRARLRREAQAMAKLSHPNVVPIYEVGEHEGRVFVAMEFVEGQTLRAFCRDEVRAWEAVLAAGIQAGRGLAAAHEAGLIHRDVKPDNILIGDDGRARVVDFGLARRSDDGEPREPRSARPNDEGGPKSSTRAPLTRAGTLMGTPAYLAPEQVERAAATAKSDQFSFCVTLYEALYGELPFADAARRARLDPGPSKRESAPRTGGHASPSCSTRSPTSSRRAPTRTCPYRVASASASPCCSPSSSPRSRSSCWAASCR
jgi:serine/threonine protein kinase